MFRYFYMERARTQFNIGSRGIYHDLPLAKLATDMTIFPLQLQYPDISHSPERCNDPEKGMSRIFTVGCTLAPAKDS